LCKTRGMTLMILIRMNWDEYVHSEGTSISHLAIEIKYNLSTIFDYLILSPNSKCLYLLQPFNPSSVSGRKILY
jgi:hypothetical protein